MHLRDVMRHYVVYAVCWIAAWSKSFCLIRTLSWKVILQTNGAFCAVSFQIHCMCKQPRECQSHDNSDGVALDGVSVKVADTGKSFLALRRHNVTCLKVCMVLRSMKSLSGLEALLSVENTTRKHSILENAVQHHLLEGLNGAALDEVII